MSYTVSAAAETPTSASISTPVCAVAVTLEAIFHAILAQPCSHINVRQRKRMTKRYPFSCPFDGGNACDPGHFEGVALGVAQPAEGGHYAGRHLYEPAGYAVRLVTGFADTSTIPTSPRCRNASTCPSLNEITLLQSKCEE